MNDQESPVGFRFATVASLIRQEGYSHERAEALMHIWERYARYAMMSGKTPENTARHLARFGRYQPKSWARDPRHIDVEEAHELVNQQIAEDLRRHANAIEKSSPRHAQVIHTAADKIEHSSGSSQDSVKAAIAALKPRIKKMSSAGRAPRSKRGR